MYAHTYAQVRSLSDIWPGRSPPLVPLSIRYKDGPFPRAAPRRETRVSVPRFSTPPSGPRWSRCCAAKTRRLHELSIEVLTSYELAEIASISEGYDLGLDQVSA